MKNLFSSLFNSGEAPINTGTTDQSKTFTHTNNLQDLTSSTSNTSSVPNTTEISATAAAAAAVTSTSSVSSAKDKDFCVCQDFSYFRTHQPHTSLFPLFVFLRSKLTNTPPPKTNVENCNQCNKKTVCCSKLNQPQLSW